MYKYLDPKKYITNLSLRLSKFISIWEKRKIEKYRKLPLQHQPVFIIGAPRTGSTILYQVLTNQLDVLYVDNLTCIFRKNFFYGFWLSNKLFGQKAHDNFKSYHGNTGEYGLRAPSECGGYWYRWLPKDRHFIDYDEITDEMVNEIRAEITAIINYFNKPIVFKNLNAGQRIRLISQCFPDAKFIFIKRDLLQTAQSILHGKRKVGKNDNEFWGIMPVNVDELRSKNTWEQITKQIYFIEKQIIKDKILIGKNNFWELNYRELTKNDFEQKAQIFLNVKNRKSFTSPEIKINEEITLDQIEKYNFLQEINKLDWDTYGLE